MVVAVLEAWGQQMMSGMMMSRTFVEVSGEVQVQADVLIEVMVDPLQTM